MSEVRGLDGLVGGGGEPGGAVAVVRDGVVEVDEVAGTRDGVAPWTADTLVLTFSVAKPFAALALLDVLADGGPAPEDPVVSLWPEYGRSGKATTTLRHLLSHQAGLPVFPEAAGGLRFDDREGLVALLEEAEPVHAPGAAVAEHALTYGHLLDEVCRRVGGEPLADRFARIAGEAGWDLHLAVADSDLHRVADLVDATGSWRAGYLEDPRWGPALGRPPGILDPGVLNSDAFRRTAFPAVSLYAGALDLARAYDDLRRPDGFVASRLGTDLWRGLVEPVASGDDLVVGRAVTWTLGMQVDDEDGRREIGMGGAGGCSAWADVTAGYGAAYVTRGLGGHDRGDLVWDAVTSAFGAR